MNVFWLGIILLITGYVISKVSKQAGNVAQMRALGMVARIVGVFIIVAAVLWSTIVIIPAGFRGVRLTFGAVSGTLDEGIHMIIPGVQAVVKMDVRTQKEPAEATAASKDLQTVKTNIALNFHIDPSRVEDLYKNVGVFYKERIIDPAVQESIKMVTAKFTAEQLIKTRSQVKAEVEMDIAKRLKAYDIIVEPSGLSITNFDFSPEFNSAIEQKQVAQQEAEKQKYILERAELERQTLITQARGASEAARLNAQALQAQGGGKVLAREWIQKWDGHVPTVSGSQGGGVIIDINQLLRQQQ